MQARSSIRGIAHLSVTVSDMGRAIAFYRALGLSVSEVVHAEGALLDRLTGFLGAQLDMATVEIGDQRLELLQFTHPVSGGGGAPRLCDRGHVHLALLVEDIDHVVTIATQAGFEAVGAIQTVDEGPNLGIRAVYMADPDGLVIEVLQPAD